jgi:ribosomal protein S18 acetylase RimI-like enzyme
MRQLTTLRELDAAGFTATLDQILAVYAAAMRAPRSQLAGRLSIMERHATYPGFRALTVTADDSGEIVAFNYGFHGVPGQWWHDLVSYALASLPYPPDGAQWLADSFEVAELHVAPAHQGRGIGCGLLLRLTAGRAERTAVLSTQDANSPARRLYRGVGFTDLLTGFRFSGGDPPYAVMGAELPLRPARA